MAAPHVEPLRLAELGFAVFPIFDVTGEPGRRLCGCGNPDCRDAGKHPVGFLAKRGLKDATRRPEVIIRWWRARAWNVGIATGGPAIVLDVDPRHGGDESLAQLEAKHGALPITWRAFTGGGGEHVYLAPAAGMQIPNSANKIGPGLDIRGTGGYVVAPPSRHISGGEYAWNVDGHPDEVPLAPMPAWLVEACGAHAAPGGRTNIASLSGQEIVEGGRNATLTRLTGHLLRRYVDPRLALDLVAAFNEARCRPPLAPAEVLKIVESIAGRELRRRRAAA